MKNNNIDNQPLVSIIMNCYNGEKYLRESIDSVYGQTYKNWEIIFWDNNSTDKSAEIANSYDSRLRYFKGESTISLGAARNKALEKLNGDYISFLDVDDLWLPKKLELQIERAFKQPETVVFYSDGYDLYDKMRTKKKFSSYRNVKIFEGNIFNKLILSNFINFQTVLINPKISPNDIYFNEDFTYSEDYELLLRLSLKGKFNYLSEPLVFYRYHENNMSNKVELQIDEDIKIYNSFSREVESRNINLLKAKSLLYGKSIIRLINNNDNYHKYVKKLISYPSIRNIIIYVLIKIKLEWLIRKIANIRKYSSIAQLN